jgi:hypothetical protein
LPEEDTPSRRESREENAMGTPVKVWNMALGTDNVIPIPVGDEAAQGVVTIVVLAAPARRTDRVPPASPGHDSFWPEGEPTWEDAEWR